MQKTIRSIAVLLTLSSPLAFGEEPVKVFILAGQSNMVGHGKVEMGLSPTYKKGDPGNQREVKGGIGGLRNLATNPKTAGKFGHLLGKDGKWVERDDVWIHSTAPGKSDGRLTVGFGKGNWFGPELQFGHRVGDAIDGPVLIIKTAWGGHSLGVNFRPPSSGKPKYEKTKYKDEDLGASYRNMLKIVKEVCADPGSRFPELKVRKTEIVGFGWHQGWNDAGSQEMVAEYSANTTNLIRDLRKDLGVKDLPVVIANTGMIGMEAKGIRAELCEIQLKMADPKVTPEFVGTIAAIETRPFKRPTEQSPSGFGYHWNHNAESHFLIGDAMGEAMVKLLKK